MAVSKEELYKLIEQIDDKYELELAYSAVMSILNHDDQSWYWTEKWQKNEREADNDITEGRISKGFDNISDLMTDIMESIEQLELDNGQK